MTMKIWNSERVTSYNLNNSFYDTLNIAGRETIRALIGSGQLKSNSQDDWFAEAYIDADGRNNTVVTGSTTATLSGTCYFVNAGSKIVFHTIPGSTFNPAISRAYATTLKNKWEVGADVQYRITNGSGNTTGWLPTGSIGSFAVFTAQPTFVEVMLMQKVSSPTGSTPAILGFSLRCD